MIETIKNFFKNHIGIIIIVLLSFIARLAMMDYLGPDYNLGSDDMAYIESGRIFYETGKIYMHGARSAQIMPGMPLLISIFVHFFGTGEELLLALKIFWILMGSLCPLVIYMILGIFLEKSYSLIGSIFFFLPDFLWQDQLILTETPFMLSLLLMVYTTFKLGQGGSIGYFILGLLAYMAGLMMKANIGIYPVFGAIYLLLKKYPFKRLLGQGLVAFAVLLTFIIPWSMRNYQIFDSFIPLTYGSGNPALLGTYQGEDYPLDGDLDLVENVSIPTMEKYGAYINDNGTLDPHYKIYVLLGRDAIQADYRKSVWYDQNPKAMLRSYFVEKPREMIFDMSFLWEDSLQGARDFAIMTRKIDIPIIIIGIIIAIISGIYFEELTFLTITYLFNIYLYAMTYSFDRYMQTLLPLRYIAFCLSIYLIVMVLVGLVDRLRSPREFEDLNEEVNQVPEADLEDRADLSQEDQVL